MILESENLKLIACDPDILKSAIQGNDSLAQKLNIKVQDNWTEFGVGALQYSLDKLSEGKDESGWWTYFPILKQSQSLIGSGGYKGKPTPEGIVEIGYEIAPQFRNLGYATEMATLLVSNAFVDNRVVTVIAHTLGQPSPSTKVLEKCGFENVEEINDPDDGLIWKWELKKM